MAIILSRGNDTKKLEKKSIELEDKLQNFLSSNPEIIPIDDIKPGAKTIILAREFPVKVGAIDILGVDKDGKIYILETKLAKNVTKREVIAQILEYGAYLYKSYTSDEFIKKLDSHIKEKENTTLKDKLSLLSIEDEEKEDFIEIMKDNFNNKAYKFFIVMDKVPEEVKNIIIFLNEISMIDIYAVELEYYEDNDIKIVIPKLIGLVSKKELVSSETRIWDKESFFDAIKEEVNDEQIKSIFYELYRFAEENSCFSPWTGRPTKSKLFRFYYTKEGKRKCLFYVVHEGSNNGSIKFYHFYKYFKDLNKIGFPEPKNPKEPKYPLEIFKEKVKVSDFIKVIKEYIEKNKDL